MITDKSIPAQAAYCAAYWEYLRRATPLPVASDYGLDEEFANVLRNQCRAEMHRKLNAQAPAVSFTKAEAAQAAEDLRGIAATCCELGHVFDERILRLLAQKFDGQGIQCEK